jgi:hypothetical protein
VLIRDEFSSDSDVCPSARFFAISKRRQTPLIRLQRGDGWDINALDANGAPLLSAAASSDELSFVTKVFTADLNRDGKPDFIVNIWSGGSGLAAERYATTFLLSDGEKYKAETFSSYDFGPEDIVNLKSNGPCYFIYNEFIDNGAEKTRDGREHNFWVYQLYRIEGANLVPANSDQPQFPKWVWYNFRGNHRETDLLTAEQKRRLLDPDNVQLEGAANGSQLSRSETNRTSSATGSRR